ncbi:MAG: AAA family ATPase [Flavobacteriales bacterium]|jgi:predicted ABC-type ATPase
MRRLYIIAGCNGAGKTTASYTILPEILNCTEFVNADEIARGLSPFQPSSAAIEAGRLMLKRIEKHLTSGNSFAFETTLSTRSYRALVKRAKELGFQVTCVFFWLQSENLAISRVQSRVKEGGHDIPEEVIRRRYHSGLKNFFELFLPLIDNWLFVDNSGDRYEIIAEGSVSETIVHDQLAWASIQEKYNGG